MSTGFVLMWPQVSWSYRQESMTLRKTFHDLRSLDKIKLGILILLCLLVCTQTRDTPDLKDLIWCNRWSCNPTRPWEMVEGWEERREAADSVFLFPVVCWRSVMRPRLRPRRPAIGQGIRWLPREAGLSRAASSDPKARNTSVFRNNADTKTETSPAPTCSLCGWLNRKTTKKSFFHPFLH